MAGPAWPGPTWNACPQGPCGLWIPSPLWSACFTSLPPGPGAFSAPGSRAFLNTAYANCYALLDRLLHPPEAPRLNLVGLGDVGGTLLTGLKLLGHELGEIGIYDPDETRMARYEMELKPGAAPG